LVQNLRLLTFSGPGVIGVGRILKPSKSGSQDPSSNQAITESSNFGNGCGAGIRQVPNARARDIESEEEKLEWLTGRTHKITQHRYVGTVRTNASCIDRQTKPLGLIKIDAGVIQFRKAETLCREHTVQSRRIYRTGRTMPLPWPSRQFVKLLPIAFVPSRHSLLADSSVRLRQAVPSQPRCVQSA
jgi:hypothetical protein